MKRCKVCGKLEKDGALTCPACGEASWEQLAADGALDQAAKVAPVQKGKR